jgi:type 1 glutamine amidotransferase
VRELEHPITKGMPEQWLHAQDECYDRLRGPAENMTILATAYSAEEFKGTQRHEPMLMVIDFGEGRIFHTTLGHEDYSFEGVGFIVSLLRGCEWAATGEVTIPIPDDFPTAENATTRKFN